LGLLQSLFVKFHLLLFVSASVASYQHLLLSITAAVEAAAV